MFDQMHLARWLRYIVLSNKKQKLNQQCKGNRHGNCVCFIIPHSRSLVKYWQVANMLFAICSNLVVLPWSVCWQLLPPCIDKTGDGFAAALITGWGVESSILSKFGWMMCVCVFHITFWYMASNRGVTNPYLVCNIN